MFKLVYQEAGLSPKANHTRCAAGWGGALCEHDIDECAAAPCSNGGACVDQQNAFACDCEVGLGVRSHCRFRNRDT